MKLGWTRTSARLPLSDSQFVNGLLPVFRGKAEYWMRFNCTWKIVPQSVDDAGLFAVVYNRGNMIVMYILSTINSFPHCFAFNCRSRIHRQPANQKLELILWFFTRNEEETQHTNGQNKQAFVVVLWAFWETIHNGIHVIVFWNTVKSMALIHL